MLADVSDTITVGEEEFRLYPLSLGKMNLLSKHEKAVSGLIDFVRTAKEPDDAEAMKKFSEAADSAIEIFHILTAPNDGKEPEQLSAEKKKELHWKLSMPNVYQMMMFVRTGNIPKEMLKNVRGLEREAAKETLENGSQQS